MRKSQSSQLAKEMWEIFFSFRCCWCVLERSVRFGISEWICKSCCNFAGGAVAQNPCKISLILFSNESQYDTISGLLSVWFHPFGYNLKSLIGKLFSFGGNCDDNGLIFKILPPSRSSFFLFFMLYILVLFSKSK